MSKAQWKIPSPIGSLYLVASEKGLQGIFFDRQSVPIPKHLKGSGPEMAILAETARELDEYFCGKRREFSIPLDVQGTPFQKQVWEELKKIPYGQTVSYRDIANRIKRAKAMRAVGSANGRNPVCIIVPCHRVIAADGSLGGYTGGLHIKTKLLNLERQKPSR